MLEAMSDVLGCIYGAIKNSRVLNIRYGLSPSIP